jgi:hypothetical protein
VDPQQKHFSGLSGNAISSPHPLHLNRSILIGPPLRVIVVLRPPGRYSWSSFPPSP